MNVVKNRTMLTLTFFVFLLMVLPRFNRNNFIVERPLNDARYFKAYVEYFRGEAPSEPIRPASNWRLLIPYLASFLPFAPITAINLLNIIACAVAVYFLYLSLEFLQVKRGLVWLGCWLFIVSFPTFYYTSIGYVDAGVLPFISMAVYFTLRNQFLGVFLAIFFGALTKETVVLILPFTIFYWWSHNKSKAVFQAILLIAMYVAVNIILRKYAYVSPGEKNPVFWGISWYAVKANLVRVNSYLAPLLSIGLPGLFFFLFYSDKKNRYLTADPLIKSIFMAIPGFMGVFFLTYITTYCDGRIIWQAYFLLIIGLIWGINKVFASVN